ncbi:MAG: DNA mismatch repair endonuclease MutL [Ruminococcaceae bacterium]|nr:DNA mismatch repair endonuclease MutL [Oscillospiraceae bacterium]
MGKINLLSFEVANLIAAGEVVDRPSSAVKELLENAVDSGASQITLEIQRGGVTFIRVSDNGCGMEKDDLVPAITRHSTSKIHTAADLDSILTLGFRGEALAAIASVSRLRIFSKIPGSDMGALLTAEGGEVKSVEDTGCADGTTVIAEDLFYNVPARRKFLKKDSTEAAAIGAVAEKIALSHPEISFRFISDGELKFLTSGSGDLREAMWALFGKDAARRSLPVDRRENGIRVSGFVCESDMFRSNRNMENFFINGRYIKSKTAAAALEQAYASKIPADKFPFCVLNIELNPAAVDVNVHPAKLEVKFANEKLIFDAVYYAVLSALDREVNRPAFPIAGDGSDADPTTDAAPSPLPKTGPDPKNAFVPMDKKPPKPEQVAMDRGGSSLGGKNPAPIKPAGPLPLDRIPAPVSGSEDKGASREEIIEAHRKAAENIRGASAAFASHTGSARQGSPDTLRGNGPTPAEIAAALLHLGTETDTKADPGSKTEADPGSKPEGRSEPEGGQKSGTTDPVSPAQTPKPEGEDPYAAYDRAIDPGDIPEYFLIGEVFNTYLIVQLSDRILLVDKHAAHERILFDELCRKLRRHFRERIPMTGQILLAPLTADLYASESEALENYRDQIEALGYVFETERRGVSGGVASISQIPTELEQAEALELFHVLATRLSDATGTVESSTRGFFESKLWQASCKAAVKGGRIYDSGHMKWICDRLLQKPDERGSVIRTCPHGRPVAFEIRKSAMDRQFGRT